MTKPTNHLLEVSIHIKRRIPSFKLVRFANYYYYHANALGATNLVLFKFACDGDLRIDEMSVRGEAPNVA